MDYGVAPASGEFEITLFGPGYGEAIAVHLGEGIWLLVDSCIDPATRIPASAAYLSCIGVAPEQVRAIVASHWHDDHVGGISELAARYPDAEFMISGVFNDDEALAFLSGYSGVSSSGLARGATELCRTVAARPTVIPVQHRSIILEAAVRGRQILVTALSPLPAAFGQALARLASYIPRERQAINHAPELRPNHEAVALHIDFGSDAVLLGADLEEHETQGWTAVVADRWSGTRHPASVYKVAHHGSRTADCIGLWETLLHPSPLTCLTPFERGGTRLPTDTDKKRIKERSASAYISSAASRRPNMDSRYVKRLGDICKNLASVDSGFGAVRFRKSMDAMSWKAELFGAASLI